MCRKHRSRSSKAARKNKQSNFKRHCNAVPFVFGDQLLPYNEFMKGKIKAEELVTFDCCLMNMQEIESPDCGAEFESIKYENLNQYRLLSTYREAVNTQLDLNEEAPEEPHVCCEIIEIWRLLPERAN